MSPVDYARTPHAQQNREAKAKQLAAAAWDQGTTAGGDLLGWEPARRRALAREVGVPVPTDPGDTWPLVADLLDRKAAWVAEHPPAPKGWDALVKAWPPLERPDARCVACKAPAVTATGGAWRCAAHPPQPGEWGARLDWTPRVPPTGCGLGRCYCTRCPDYRPL